MVLYCIKEAYQLLFFRSFMIVYLYEIIGLLTMFDNIFYTYTKCYFSIIEIL